MSLTAASALGEALIERFGASKVVLTPAEVARLSRDFCWYSPILAAQLEHCVAQAVLRPEDEADVLEAVRFALETAVPITVRGAGTGNYGQAVPLAGGIVLDMTRMNRVLVVGQGWMRAQAGARMGTMETAALAEGQELRLLPSTYEKATIGGFVCGGAGGLGSVAYGWLWDGNLLGCRLVTAEMPPRVRTLTGPTLAAVEHGYGTTGILTEVTVPLVPSVPWSSLVLTFPSLDHALDFAADLTARRDLRKRLVSVSEAALGPLFNVAMPAATPLIRDTTRHPVLVMVAVADCAATLRLAEAYGGDLERELPARGHPTVSDFSFNHVTLWAKKVEPAWTYLQSGYDPQRLHEQVALVRARFGDDVLHHFEFVTSQGQINPGGLLLVRYRGIPSQLDNLIAFLEANGVTVANPHRYVLECEPRRRRHWSEVLAAKAQFDPLNLLNPGKLPTIP